MIKRFAANQIWARLCPFMGIIAAIVLFSFSRWDQPIFWALCNIPLYLFHQTEEHYWPGGFKKFMNEKIFNLPVGEETLTDIKIFWINILLVGIAFLIFGIAACFNIGFGLCIIIFSIMNCLTHILQGIKMTEWNPGLVMSLIQFSLSLYAAYFITSHGLSYATAWWIGSCAFSVIIHLIVFKVVMSKK
jgi:hypothetical protein